MKLLLLFKKGVLAGFFVAIASVVLSIVSLFVPPAGCLWCIVTFIPGILSAYYVKKKLGSITLIQGGITGGIAGFVSCLLTLIVFDPLLILLGGILGGVPFFTDDSVLKTTLGGVGFGMIAIVIAGSILALIVSGVINAVSGLLYVVYEKK